MALAIDTGFLAGYYLNGVQKHLDALGGRTRAFHVYRICAHTTVVHDASAISKIHELKGIRLATREAQDWQADQDDDLDEVEVFHHLHQQAKTSPLFEEAFSQTERTNATTTLVTSCAVQSSSLAARVQGRPLSSFHRYSLRQSLLITCAGFGYDNSSNIQKLCPCAPDGRFDWYPWITTTNGAGGEPSVIWHLQVDFVDLLSPRSHPTWRPRKRRRSTLNPFHQVSSPPVQESSPANHLHEAKRFKGVRYRRDRRTWAAEMKPPKYKGKVSFGEFKSQAQAARAIDAAFHYYGKPHLLNFPDTPRILSARPTPAGVLDEGDKLTFVKEQVKWMASMASRLPSSPPWVPSEIPQLSSRACTGDTSGFRTISEIASFLNCGDADDADDGISQPLPSLHPAPTGGLVGNGCMEPNFMGADAVGAIIGTLEEPEGMLEWSLEDVFADPWSPCRSVQITDGWDGAEDSSAPALTNFTNSAQPCCESQGSWRNYLVMSPPASMI